MRDSLFINPLHAHVRVYPHLRDRNRGGWKTWLEEEKEEGSPRRKTEDALNAELQCIGIRNASGLNV
ncbi:hypothetical protein DRO19_00355 [Candidatus Bathyarchaeota archaeon]|nr:MAG: hypothetical protein DRO19_00355 [Candidatus Bathyarchaeota archaeon]